MDDISTDAPLILLIKKGKLSCGLIFDMHSLESSSLASVTDAVESIKGDIRDE